MSYLRENRSQIQVFLVFLAVVGALTGAYTMIFSESPGPGDAAQNARNTSTALALTSDALLGPFPTHTKPSPTATDVRSATPVPSDTPTASLTPTRTLIPIHTMTAQTHEPRPTSTNTRRPSATPRPTRTQPPRPTATNPPPDSPTPDVVNTPDIPSYP